MAALLPDLHSYHWFGRRIGCCSELDSGKHAVPRAAAGYADTHTQPATSNGWLADLQSCNLSAGAAKATFALSHHSVDEVLQIALGRKVWNCGRLDRLELHSLLSLEGFESQSATPLLNSGTATIGKCSSSSTRGSNSSVHPELAPCASQAKGPVFQRSPELPLSW